MTLLQELQEDVQIIKDTLALTSLTQDERDSFTSALQTKEVALDLELSKQTTSTSPTTSNANQSIVPQQNLTQLVGASNPVLNTIVSTIANMMTMAGGSGVDSASVMAIIDNYRKLNKIKLDELDSEILEEIKKNQTILLLIPEFSKPIEINKATALIPNFFDIIDDIMAGNNVYLIGEAGGGKTYTAEQVAKTLKREYVTLNCSQYTSPLEILGGQSVDGFKQGKLIDCWKKGKILIMDEMPKLDPNTAGLFNDALAKSSKTRPASDAKISSANPDEAPVERAKDFAIIATGNIYPNQPPPPQYRGNNQQDLSLLDRFSGSVYYTEFDKNTDQETTRFTFLFQFLIGNYYDYIQAKKEKKSLPVPTGLRTIIDANNFKNLSLVSYRTNISFRVAFEFELVRAIAKKSGQTVNDSGKTLLKTFKSYMVAFRESTDAFDLILVKTGFTDEYIQNLIDDEISNIISSGSGFLDSLNPLVKENAAKIYGRYEDFYVSQEEVKP